MSVRASSLRILVVLLAVSLAGICGEAKAQTGWLPTAWFSQDSVDPKAMFPLAESDGPWLVLATTFRGEGARDDARRLVQELRGSHKLKAYTHEKSFDFTGNQRGLGLNPDGSPKKMRFAKAEQVIEVAVLVGDFASFDDPRGQKMLGKIKNMQPDAARRRQWEKPVILRFSADDGPRQKRRQGTDALGVRDPQSAPTRGLLHQAAGG